MNEDKPFMNSHEDNDEIRHYVKRLIGEDKQVNVLYHEVSDGKHKLIVENKEFQVNAWSTKEDLKELLKPSFEIKRLKYARMCNVCEALFDEGYCVGGGEEYYCSDECLHKHYTQDEFNEMHAEGNGDTYWTSWECEEDMQYYEDGSEVEEDE